jgi:hypothetical protein
MDLWGMLERAMGKLLDEWPAEFKSTARNAVLGVAGEVWRRLVQFYCLYPWILVPLADPDVPLARKQAILLQFFNFTSEESLDRGFSLKLKRLVERPQAFWMLQSATLWACGLFASSRF